MNGFGTVVRVIWRLNNNDVGVVVYNYVHKENESIVAFVLLANKCTRKLCKESGNTHDMQFVGDPIMDHVIVAWETIHTDCSQSNSDLDMFVGASRTKCGSLKSPMAFRRW